MRNVLVWLFFLSFFACSSALNQGKSEQQNTFSGVVKTKVVWSGSVVVDKDLMIDKDGELIILKGTVVKFVKSDISRTEPTFLYPETELLVKGKITVKGEKESPVIFQSAEENKSNRDWAGIILHGGEITGSNFIVKDAYNGLAALNGKISLEKGSFFQNNIGFAVFDDVTGQMNNILSMENQTGALIDNKKLFFKDITLSRNNEGLLLKNISSHAYNFNISENIYGLVMREDSLPFLLKENRVYENKNNIFIFDNTDTANK